MHYYLLLSNIDRCHKDELIMKLVKYALINGNMGLEQIFDEGNTMLNKFDTHSLITYYDFYLFTHIY